MFCIFLYFSIPSQIALCPFVFFSFFRHAVKEQNRESTNVCCISLLLLISPLSAVFLCNLGLYFFLYFLWLQKLQAVASTRLLTTRVFGKSVTQETMERWKPWTHPHPHLAIEFLDRLGPFGAKERHGLEEGMVGFPIDQKKESGFIPNKGRINQQEKIARHTKTFLVPGALQWAWLVEKKNPRLITWMCVPVGMCFVTWAPIHVQVGNTSTIIWVYLSYQRLLI